MFPTLNFKQIKCPLLKNCKNGPFCLFSHSVIQSKRLAVPIQGQSKRLATDSNSLKKDLRVDVVSSFPQNQLPKSQLKSQTTSSKEQQSHTPLEIDPSSRPIIATDIYGKVPKLKRQKVLDKLYEEFLRIYVNLPKTIAYQHSIKQEEFIYENSTVQSYISKATSIFTRLKKRPIAQHEGDVGIDGEWKETVVENIPITELKELIMSSLDQTGYDYPSPNLLKMKNLEKNDNPKKRCERCSTVFIPIPNPSQTECSYHWGKLVSGSSERAFTCCQSTIGSVGCSQGPHVYKDTNDIDLHSKIHFDSAPEGKGKDVVALDCEMGYTLGGLELVRA
ncbi:RNA exonuclease 3, partial [Boothiomyces sp. JEL0866]